MRHLLLIGTLALTTLLTACSAHDDGADQTGMNQTEPVSFTADVSSATRSVINSLDNFKTAGKFRVWAWMTDNGGATYYPMTSDFNASPLLAVDVTWNSKVNAWQTAQTYYWPRPRYTVDFYAVYPTSAATYFNTTNKTLDFTTNPVPGNLDLMYATYQGHRTSTDTKQGQAVPLQFKHAFAQISFSGKLSEQFLNTFHWTLEVGAITICNVNSKGSFSLTPATGQLTTIPSSPAAPLNYTLVPPSATNAVTLNSTDAVALTSATDVTMLLPQTLTAWDKTKTADQSRPNTSDSYLAVQVRIKDYNGNYILGSEPTEATETTEATDGYATVYTPFSTPAEDWQSAQHYNYTITFGGGYDANGYPVVADMTLSCAIQPWRQTAAVSGTATH